MTTQVFKSELTEQRKTYICPMCNTAIQLTQHSPKNRFPLENPYDVTVCYGCAAMLKITATFRLAELTLPEYLLVRADVRKLLGNAQLIARAKLKASSFKAG